MATRKVLDGKPYAGNAHVRFDDGEVASAATPRRWALLCKSLMLAAGMSAAMLARGATNYVDCALQDYAGHDGSSWELAFETIQEAVDAAAAGDTVLVAPGMYAKGETREDSTTNAILNRVVIKKSLTLKSRDGAASTFIVGRQENGGIGDTAVRGVVVTSSSIDVVVEGFTICGGGTRDGGNVRLSQGGGVWAQSSSAPRTFVVDCVISNNIATRGGGMWGGMAIRSLFTENRSTGPGTGMRCGSAFNCIFAERYATSPYAMDSGRHVVNCTFVGCSRLITPEGGSYENDYRNCVFAVCATPVNTSKTAKLAIFRNCAMEIAMREDRINEESSAFANGTGPLLFSPATGDYRPLAGSEADGTGALEHLEIESIPARYRDTDFFGNPRVTDGKIDMGAIQGTVESRGGLFVFEFYALRGRLFVDGVEVFTSGLYSHVDRWPQQFCTELVPAEGEIAWGVQQNGAWQHYRFTDANRAWLTMPLPGQIVTNTAYYAEKVVWASPDGDDAYTGDDLGSFDHPYGTLQAAVNAVNATVSRGIVYAKAGVYDKGETWGQSASNRVWIARGSRLIAVDGPERTFIVGQKDDADTEGCGPASIRCVGVQDNVNCAIEGFTLTGGYSVGSGTMGGGAFMAQSGRSYAQVIGCVISNNVSQRAPAAWGGWLQNCLISENKVATGGNSIVRNGFASGCVFRNNSSISCTVGYSCKNYNCTIIAPGKTVNAAETYLFNSIVSSAAQINRPSSDDRFLGNILYSVSTINATNGYVNVDPKLMNRAAGDIRLRADSPAIGAGTADVSEFARFATTGYGGDPLLIVDGKPTIGASQKPVPVVEVAAGDVEPAGVQVLEPGETLEVRATAAARNFLGFKVGDEFVEASGGTRAFTYTAPTAAVTAPVSIAAIYATNWYVNADAQVGSDANDGWTPETPKLTLVGAMANVVSGDVVHAASGVYDTGDALSAYHYTANNDACPSIRSRVVVPRGVTLAGESRETTFVMGRSGDMANGLGTNALRCVYLEAGASIREFTISGGRTAPKESADYQDDNYMGGGVRGVSYRTTCVENCIVTNCISFRGGAGLYTTLKNCLIVGNSSTGNGSAGRSCVFENCLITRNTGSMPILMYISIMNCTYLGDNANPLGGPDPNAAGLIANSVICKAGGGASSSPKEMVNVMLVGGATMTPSVSETNTRTCTTAEAALDAGGRPAWGSVLIDAGDTAAYAAAGGGAVDYCGGQRVYNGQIDIGCYEYDWRPRYASLLGASTVSVTAASPETVATADGVLVKGGALELAWTAAAQAADKRRFTCEVTGNGELTMSQGNVACGTFVAADGRQEVPVGPELVAERMLFAYEPGTDDAGGAWLSRFMTVDPLVIIFR